MATSRPSPTTPPTVPSCGSSVTTAKRTPTTSATSVAVSADGTKVFVTGVAGGESPKGDWATIAYSVS
jgi:hypothetical protein